ncbi:S-adenosylmethionine:tRNA ribosyltransferase-isomerase [Fulvivirga sp. RKSG066]|uniref:S-adenosylmethionine:tRNA ribosyltransferase-isomerase n=1 Tax=Fulvivirga aurantia TaxID=2529383 RepID=UPI0012BC3A24|nr:S-adenosylmethionine:tRNA ribosyltransferase-isomerase [Fulvivirga aurantia]MTI22998.1 S-adenosylmethionine:tRNA ribosyltransferase-isomerase [Fulvivirga aurantia]
MIDPAVTNISLSDYKYELPEERIAKFPLKNRSESKLQLYEKGNITHKNFSDLPDHIPAGATLFFNDTKVIPARLHFRKATGALIEIFLLEPIKPTRDIAEAMLVQESATWKCMVGNFKKWKGDAELIMPLEIDGKAVDLIATIDNREEIAITFTWPEAHRFVDIVEAAGKVPLPPYIDREVEKEDHDRYQTIYSAHEGAVAAPTAGLHFTDEVLAQLKSKHVNLDYLTLHVSAGTFQPIKEENALDHPMHSEQVVIKTENLETLLKSEKVIAVGTTSMRTLESLYWFGVKILKEGSTSFQISKLYPYDHTEKDLPTMKEAVTAVKTFMTESGVSQIHGHTEIFIFPGYKFRVCDGLITNYHLPGSTLILLVAAFIGEDWKKIYQEALDKNYRFLSYGDSSLLLP